MVQKEVRKKTKIYGTVAVLSAIILVSLIYAFGASPTIFPPNQTPSVSGMKAFSSLQELKNYINNTSQQSTSFAGGPLDSQFFGEPAPVPAPASISPSTGNSLNSPSVYSAQSGESYSTTNVQVAGVDEADTVKTDGQYIYTVTTTQNTGYYFGGYNPQTSNAVYIINADPQNPQVISKISLGNDTEPAGLFLSSDGNKLVVIASKYQTYAYDNAPVPMLSSGGVAMPMLSLYQADVYTYINVYDVSNKADPVLTRNFTVSGSYFDSRMIGNYVYVVVSQPAMDYNNSVTLPAIYNGDNECDISPTSVYYADMVAPSYYTFTSFFGINISDDTQQPTNMTVMMGGTSTMYVSQNNMYVTYPTWTDSGEFTSIYSVGINGTQLTFEAQGNVPGYVINQYSMDEYNGYFRVATNWQGNTEMNNVYVLNSSLDIVGKLEGLAENEDLYAARFMGNTCYLVTFKQTDPFFVIDLSNPEAPKVAGELNIPGYSSYLQPYDANHVIGLGVENDTLKLSLFDVTDINNPTEIASYTVEANYSTSSALTDPKAFLFDLQKQLLVIPVSITNYGQVDLNGSQVIPPLAPGSSEPNYIISGTSYWSYWQGAYVFSLSLNGGFTLEGTMTHLNSTLLDSQGFMTDSSAYYNSQNDWITRSLYIGNTLYTISNSEVQLTNLTDMTQIAQINLT
jgi:uncharacterized secreted protein with C-terminal beta-propeller domain